MTDVTTTAPAHAGTEPAGTDDPLARTSPDALWHEDTGTLASESARRALLTLVRGPYLSAARHPALWSALLSDESAIRSRLHDLFLDLVVDLDAELAFVRRARTDEVEVPSTVRTVQLTFLDTAMLLVLRELLLSGQGERRVIVGRDEVFERLQVFRTRDRDEQDFSRRLNASWTKMRNTLRVVHSAGAARADDDDRVEISPVLRVLVDERQVRAIGAEYDRIAAAEVADRPTNQETDR